MIYSLYILYREKLDRIKFRRECLGIPSEVEADVLEKKVVAIFEKLKCNIPTERIEVCHRTSKKKFHLTVIFMFSQRKDWQQVWDVKRDLRKLK